MSGMFIDFKLLRNSLDADTIIAHYQIKVARKSGDQYSVHSPFKEDRRPSMGINSAKRVWKCHATGLGGNLLDLVTRLEGLDPDDKDGIREGALAAHRIFGGEGVSPGALASVAKAERVPVEASAPEDVIAKPPTALQTTAPLGDEGDNGVLTFELKLASHHRMLVERGFKKSTYETFGVGYCKRGMMKNRICFPLRNPTGDLVGYAGRWADSSLPDGEARYLLPPEFKKARILYNWDRIAVWEPTHVVIVEGFWSVLRLEEAGIPCVATLGHQLFQPQIDILVDAGVEKVTILFDGDGPGRTGAANASAALAPHLFVRNIVLQDDVKPDDMSNELLADFPRFE